jgi:hypoxanthine phosphoribosyltransferase
MPTMGLDDVRDRLAGLSYPETDAVVAVERGGGAPVEIVAELLGVPLGRLRFQFRNDTHAIVVPRPRLIGEVDVPAGRRILVVDDVSVTGATLRAATDSLADREVTTVVLRGEADLVAYPELDACVRWPWSGDTDTP